MRTTQRFSVLIWADKRKTDSANHAPLYAKVTYLGKLINFIKKKDRYGEMGRQTRFPERCRA